MAAAARLGIAVTAAAAFAVVTGHGTGDVEPVLHAALDAHLGAAP